MGAFSWPATALGPTNGLAASNLAWPQGVKGGRTFASTAFMPGTPSTMPSGYCIQTPERSWERVEGGPLSFPSSDGLPAWANIIGVKARLPANAARQRGRLTATAFIVRHM